MSERELEHLILTWRGPLFATALAVLPGRYDDAQDAVAAALVRIARHAPQLRQPERFGAWACQIARREASRLARRPRLGALPESLAVSASDNTLRLDIEAALARLPAQLALTLALYYQQGQSVGEIATALGVAEGTIKWRLSRGREQLRTELRGYQPMEKTTCALIAPTSRPHLREALYAAGFAEVVLVRTFPEAVALAARQDIAAVVLEEWVEGHSAFELLPLLRQNPAYVLWLLLERGTRTDDDLRAAATAAYITGVDLLLTLPCAPQEYVSFAQRLFSKAQGQNDISVP